MTYVFDLDGTLCVTKGREYREAVPLPGRIAKVNALFEAGHRIVIDSARGSLTKQDWSEVTREQLRAWGVKYTDVRVGVKIYADVYVDDRAAAFSEFFDAH